MTATMTPFDVTDALSAQAVKIVEKANRGRRHTDAEFIAAVERVFGMLFDRFLTNLDATKPAVAAEFRRQLLAQGDAAGFAA
ncbi:hypothetical protein [Nocardia asiatica]